MVSGHCGSDKFPINARRARIFLCAQETGDKKFTAILSPLKNEETKKPLFRVA
nr:MAG TPA: hypothetical protein [Caudoviricetes sp.]